ncbi:MAG: hypothetical protein ACP5R4_11305 [Armatimonadota bacterium]
MKRPVFVMLTAVLLSISLVFVPNHTQAEPAAREIAVFNPADLDLAPGETYLFGVHVRNPLGKRVKAVITLVPSSGLSLTIERWEGILPPWGVKLFPRIKAATTRSADGTVTVELQAEGKKIGSSVFHVRHALPQADLTADWPSKCVVFKITNTFRSRRLKGGVRLSNPDRFLQDITTGLFDVEPGKTAEIRIPVPGASPAEGEAYRFTAEFRTWEGYRGRIIRDLVFIE